MLSGPVNTRAALHDLDPVFRQFSRSPKVAAVLRSLGYQRPLPVQSMYIFKQPHIGELPSGHTSGSFPVVLVHVRVCVHACL